VRSENNDIIVLYLHVNLVIFESNTLPGFTSFIDQEMPLHQEDRTVSSWSIFCLR